MNKWAVYGLIFLGVVVLWLILAVASDVSSSPTTPCENISASVCSPTTSCPESFKVQARAACSQPDWTCCTPK